MNVTLVAFCTKKTKFIPDCTILTVWLVKNITMVDEWFDIYSIVDMPAL